jgi:hypothetical protein
LNQHCKYQNVTIDPLLAPSGGITLLPSQHWASNFKVNADDIDYLMHLLLEKETPLTTQDLAHALVENRLQQEADALEERYKDTKVYIPSGTFQEGQRLVFPHLSFATGTVVGTRSGNNPDYGNFNVIQVEFEDESKIEFASNLEVSHKLSEHIDDTAENPLIAGQITTDEIFDTNGDQIISQLEKQLRSLDDLVTVAHHWFPKGLMLQPDEGHHHLAEAVLDMYGGGPLDTKQILEEIGGIGTSPMSLQLFSMNYSLNQDDRFEEVGPSGQILWYLKRMAPNEIISIPAMLSYSPIDYDPTLLVEDMVYMEAEIDDELSDIDIEYTSDSGSITLIYPHRRTGSLPLNSRVRHLFPTAQRTEHVWIRFIDVLDHEEFEGWVIPSERYVYGLGKFYAKHALPIGTQITVTRGDTPDKVLINFEAYKPRTEWIRLITPKGDTFQFENTKRAIGADYDDLMVLGIDDLEALDTTLDKIHKQRRTLASLLMMLIPALGKLTPQGTAHIKTIYSAVNVIRRCPPGPIMAILEANPDFENVGGHYWKLSDA